MSMIGGIYQSLIKASAPPAKSGLNVELRTRLSVARMYLRSREWAREQPDLFEEVRNYVMLLGHARSGGSLMGGLLDAHPNVIIGDEVDVFPYINAKFNRRQIFHILLERSQRQARKRHVKAGRDGKIYSYYVPGAWQGDFERLFVMGNSKAGISTQRIGRDPRILDLLQKAFGNIQVKLIFVVRNPYDAISTMSIRSGRDLESLIAQYFSNCATMKVVKDACLPENLLLIRHEDLLNDPDIRLRQLCSFLGIPAPDLYMSACSSIIYPSPAVSRSKVKWNPELLHEVGAHIESFSFLEGYSYES